MVSKPYPYGFPLLSDLQSDLEFVKLELFLVDHIRHPAEAEDLAPPAMRIHLRIIPALAAKGLDGDLLICSAPYFNTPAFLAQRPQAAIALYDGLSVIADAAQSQALAVCFHKRTLHCFF